MLFGGFFYVAVGVSPHVCYGLPQGHLPALLQIPSQDFLLLREKVDLWLSLSCQLTPPATAGHIKQHVFGTRVAVYSASSS